MGAKGNAEGIRGRQRQWASCPSGYWAHRQRRSAIGEMSSGDGMLRVRLHGATFPAKRHPKETPTGAAGIFGRRRIADRFNRTAAELRSVSVVRAKCDRLPDPR